MTKVISYWSGNIPRVAELHFRSFLSNTSTATYTLFVENCDIEGTPWLSSILQDRRFTIESHPWDILADRLVSKKVTVRDLAGRRKGLLAPAASLLRRQLSRLCRSLGLRQIRGWRGRYQLVGGWDFDTDSRFFDWRRWVTYRADILRVLAPQRYPNEDVLWVDLDTYFVRDLEEWARGESFAYRWEDKRFANNAIMYFSAQDQARRIIEMICTELSNFRPWYYLTDSNCRRAGMEILEPRQFDPTWSDGSPMRGNPSLFMSDSQVADSIVEYIEKNCAIVHWHNQWRSDPGEQSPYSLLLNSIKRKAGHAS